MKVFKAPNLQCATCFLVLNQTLQGLEEGSLRVLVTHPKGEPYRVCEQQELVAIYDPAVFFQEI